eukprot:CAMPEP_0195293608 /NCGR_PEP_ID=MMETSP0707-20130614/12876_1 /TAXON_ID=33640 /ORGANISM="Asterionellopsis glacialis, Strain CCMP134" /LENGTH=338 /DNA_ID=CAMNT_0040354359 /DNA_START=109 /DNA_END=1125 /DNA_ORIENTATION=+
MAGEAIDGSEEPCKGESSSSEEEASSTEESSESDLDYSTSSQSNLVPKYLRGIVFPYHGEFYQTRCFHPNLIAQLMSEGFLPISLPGVLLPKLHQHRCAIRIPENLHVSKSTRKKANRFHISVNEDFMGVVKGCRAQHGRQCWLYRPLVEAFLCMNKKDVNVRIFDKQGHPTSSECTVRLYSIEVWNTKTGALAGGELGYTVGHIYTSLTGFSKEDSAGSVQLAALGRMLCKNEFKLWDLGMDMDYKQRLGGSNIPRNDYVKEVREVRESLSHIVLPVEQGRVCARAVIDKFQNGDESAKATNSKNNHANAKHGNDNTGHTTRKKPKISEPLQKHTSS